MRSAVALALLCSIGSSLLAPAAAAQAAGERPRVIVLGFDGVDHGLTEQFMAEGHLPNLSALAAEGTFSRLETTNPAESAVSWSTFGRGQNPGKTKMFGFVCRKAGTYQPELRFMKTGERPFTDFYEESSSLSWSGILAAAAAGLLVGLLLGAARKGGPSGLVLGLVVGAASGGVAAMVSASGAAMPKYVPSLETVADGEPLWNRLDGQGVRVKGFLVPMAAPFEDLEHAKITGGLGVPDITGAPIGKFSVFSTSREDVPVGNEQTTASQGKVVRLIEKDGAFVAALTGPEDMARRSAVETRMAEIGKLAGSEKQAAREELRELSKERNQGFDTQLPVRVRRVDGDKSVEVTIGDQTVTVADGAWSGWIPLDFGLAFPFEARGLARFRVMSVAGDIRLFFAPLGYHPNDVPKHMCMEHPHGFGKELAAGSETLFDTTGWACISNPLKDAVVGEDVFLEHMAKLTEERSKVLNHALGEDDYDFYFSVFGETDRVQHLMYRLIDDKNPMYDAELAAKYGSAILDSYKAMDKTVGEVVKRFVDGNTYLFVISDHGFTSFRRQMAINTWLIEEGYLVPTRGGRDPVAVMDKVPESQQDFLLYMDKRKSRAFALGLGKIYINLKGRESEGIVDKAEYEALCAEITEKLLALRDPETGAQVVSKVWRHHELYTGEYAETDADLYLGFAEYYRVSWSTTLGGFSAKVIEDNDLKWSGDHASNDPDVVPGVLFTNRPLDGGQKPSIIDLAPTILQLYGVPIDDLDGRTLTFR